MRDIRVSDDIFTGPATDELLDDVFFMRWVDDDEFECRPPDAIDRFLERRRAAADDDAEAGGLPSAA